LLLYSIPRGCQHPIPNAEFGMRISESNSAPRNLQSTFDITSQENSSISLPGWDVATSSMPSLQFVGFSPG